MRIRLFFSLIGMVLLAMGCQDQHPLTTSINGPSNKDLLLEGDSTVYGLACEGCNDSVVVLLPNDGSDPVRYDIIDATRAHNIRGNIKTGDWIGLVLNKQDKKVADLVVDLDQLKGIWCYIVMPKMRDYDKMSKKLQSRLMRNMPDSMKRTFLIPREYGFWLKRQWEASSVGYVPQVSTLADESPVVYPPLGYFVKWHIWNGKFVMISGKPKFDKENKVVGYSDVSNDTCSIDYLDEDSLVLSDRDGSRSYYRKNDINEVNKKAQAIANQITKAALKKSAEE